MAHPFRFPRQSNQASAIASSRSQPRCAATTRALLLAGAWLLGACVADSSGDVTLGSGSGGAVAVGSGGAAVPGTGGASTPPAPAGTGGSIPNGTATGGDSGAIATGGSSTGGSGGIGGTDGGSTSSGGRIGNGGSMAAGGTGPGTGGTAGSTGPTGGGCGTAKVCDDFESYSTPTNLSPWTTSVSGGSVMIDGTHVYSGKQAVLIHADAGANKKAQINRMGAPLFPANPNLFWGRMMVYMSALPASSVHYDNVQGDGTGTGQYRIGGMGGILLNYEPHDCYDHIMPMLPQNKWSCWQWLYDGTKNTIEFYVDGKLQAQVMSTSQGCVDGTNSVWAAPTFNAVHLGWVNYQATTAGVDLWLDDVALGPDQIACPAVAPGAK